MHRDKCQLGVCICAHAYAHGHMYMNSNSSSQKNTHGLNMSGVSTEYLKWYLPEREDKIGLFFLTSRECNSLAAQRKTLAQSEDLFYMLVSALYSKQFSINMAFSSLV